jgi:gamma-glutamyl-gamma-aminobutyrate hydrolase PuuD
VSAGPLVGIPADVLPVRHRRKYTVYNTYVEAVRGAGARPVGLFPSPPEGIPAMLDLLDGVALVGGDDLHPRHWGGEEVHPKVTLSSDERSEFELELVRAAASRGVPLLAICLGFQTVNVAFGGSVVQHIEDGSHGRGDPEGVVTVRHALEIEPGSRLHSILGAGRVEVNSSHHQTLGRIGEGLAVTARAQDGVAEAIEGTGPGFLLAIQWHPEEAPDDPVNRAVLAAFVDAAARRDRGPGG